MKTERKVKSVRESVSLRSDQIEFVRQKVAAHPSLNGLSDYLQRLVVMDMERDLIPLPKALLRSN